MSKKFNFNDKLDAVSGKLKVVDKLKIWAIIPTVILLVAIIVFSIFAAVEGDASKGMNLGLDFTGGSAVTITFNKDLNDADFNAYSQRVIDVINSVAESNNDKYECGEAQKTGSGADTGIYIKYQNGHADIQEVNIQIKNALVEEFSAEGINADDNINITSISSTAASKLVKQTIIAVLVTWAVVLVYIIIRFEFLSGVAAVVGLLVDVIVMISCTTIFRVQVNTTFIAALITIVSYSINNTIVVFDRVREHVKNQGTALTYVNVGYEVNNAVRESFNRSVASTITTMLTILVLCIMGVESIQQFCLPIIFGLVSGINSSLCLAPSLYVLMKSSYLKRKANKSSYVAVADKDGNLPTQQPKKKKVNTKANKSVKYKRKK